MIAFHTFLESRHTYGLSLLSNHSNIRATLKKLYYQLIKGLLGIKQNLNSTYLFQTSINCSFEHFIRQKHKLAKLGNTKINPENLLAANLTRRSIKANLLHLKQTIQANPKDTILFQNNLLPAQYVKLKKCLTRTLCHCGSPTSTFHILNCQTHEAAN